MDEGGEGGQELLVGQCDPVEPAFELGELIRAERNADKALLELDELTDQGLERLRAHYLELARQAREQHRQRGQAAAAPSWDSTGPWMTAKAGWPARSCIHWGRGERRADGEPSLGGSPWPDKPLR